MPGAPRDGAAHPGTLEFAPTDNLRDGPAMRITRRIVLNAVLIAGIAGLAACAPQAPTPTDSGRFLVYFDEFSANLTPEAKRVIGDSVRRAKETGARSMRIEGRASATGSPTANQYLAQTRSQVVVD
jgi:outer membrane protein OmpA-like peptidoglycan-associated protein